MPRAPASRAPATSRTGNRTAGGGAGGPASSTLAVFAAAAEEDDEDENGVDGGRRGVNRALQAASRQQVSQEVREATQDALAQDRLIFDYDGSYGAMLAHRNGEMDAHALVAGGGAGVGAEVGDVGGARKRQRTQSRYIGGLLEQAKVRAREDEAAYERKMLRERAAEDALYGDKEAFVTTAYKRKLQEQQRWREEEAQQEEREKREDVAARGDMNSFYANMMSKNVSTGAVAAVAGTSAYTPGAAGAGPAAPAPASQPEPEPEPRGEHGSDGGSGGAKPQGAAAALHAGDDSAAWKEQRRRQIDSEARAESKRRREEAEEALRAQAEAHVEQRKERAEAIRSARARYFERKRDKALAAKS
eukprot:g7362.t1